MSAYESGAEDGDLLLSSVQPLLAPFNLQDLSDDLEAALMGLTVQVQIPSTVQVHMQYTVQVAVQVPVYQQSAVQVNKQSTHFRNTSKA